MTTLLDTNVLSELLRAKPSPAVLAWFAAQPPERLFAVSERRSLGRPISQFDAQIVAIARQAGAKLATRKTTDFERCGVTLIDPWSGSVA